MLKTLNTKIIKRFYNISGPLDEYKRSEVNRIGNNLGIMLFLFNVLIIFIALLIEEATNNSTLALHILIGAILIFTVYIAGGYVMYEAHRYRLTDNEVEEKEVRHAYIAALKRGLGNGIYFGVGMYLLDCLQEYMSVNASLVGLFLDKTSIIYGIMCGILFGVTTGIVYLARIKRVK
ncbi:DUF3278 domain-containing protein [Limosilactobacillus sp. STM2_1]|uniref:DUF3278 domain-containing protein n=1 Tax=Limosilactobacillus rudii TaxID=2759755 RepID=A0A7W3ULG4_9LACO|nr:DUF3278 domain-containing protein [Limosilactobacillus rudii]MBB1079757.1 DUF3278 domain-containing protein [Limosilactobacillus rudii]MBB1097783.1 DUF3278 domain-containing protein [Limosilactobacillus rudii]MCD7134864.1 DUF3278 domain-containing protein [Limosilactobacillus rudii]